MSELERLVRELAASPERWAHLVRHDADQRVYEELHRDDDVAIWLICWMDDHDTGFHDHDLSSGAVAVVAGAVAEDRLALGGPPVTREFGAGRGVPLQRGGHPPRPPHRRRARGDDPRLLAAAVADGRLRDPADGGELRRHSLSYAEELRPLS